MMKPQSTYPRRLPKSVKAEVEHDRCRCTSIFGSDRTRRGHELTPKPSAALPVPGLSECLRRRQIFNLFAAYLNNSRGDRTAIPG